MAEADLYLSGDEICCICLSEFCDPVSTPCGHNFCRSCITRHIQVKADCPTCRTKFNKGLTLRVNNVLRTLLEKAKKIQTQETKESKVEPGEVLCDKCLRGKAVKTCLDCNASFCGKHLDPHKQHLLTDLVENSNKNWCRQHGKKLKFFCWDDMEAFCKLCKAHKSHHTVSLKLHVEKSNQRKAAVEGDNEVSGEAIGSLLQKLHERQVAEVLQNEIANHERKSFCLNCLIDRVMEQVRHVFRTCCQKILVEKPKKMMRVIQDLESVPEGVRMVVIKQQYEVDVEIDPSTASSNLLLMSKCSKGIKSNNLWLINGLPTVFDSYAYVLGKDTLPAGRSYFEVSTEMKTGWDLGVARESIRRGNSVTPSVKNGTWVIRLRDNTKLQALGIHPISIPLVGKLKRIGVFVDREKKRVSFYDAQALRLIYSFTRCEFKGDILPFFSPCPYDAGRNFAPLVLASPHTTGTNYSTIACILIAFLFFYWFIVNSHQS